MYLYLYLYFHLYLVILGLPYVISQHPFSHYSLPNVCPDLRMHHNFNIQIQKYGNTEIHKNTNTNSAKYCQICVLIFVWLTNTFNSNHSRESYCCCGYFRQRWSERKSFPFCIFRENKFFGARVKHRNLICKHSLKTRLRLDLINSTFVCAGLVSRPTRWFF